MVGIVDLVAGIPLARILRGLSLTCDVGSLFFTCEFRGEILGRVLFSPARSSLARCILNFGDV